MLISYFLPATTSAWSDHRTCFWPARKHELLNVGHAQCCTCGFLCSVLYKSIIYITIYITQEDTVTLFTTGLNMIQVFRELREQQYLCPYKLTGLTAGVGGLAAYRNSRLLGATKRLQN